MSLPVKKAGLDFAIRSLVNAPREIPCIDGVYGAIYGDDSYVVAVNAC